MMFLAESKTLFYAFAGDAVRQNRRERVHAGFPVSVQRRSGLRCGSCQRHSATQVMHQDSARIQLPEVEFNGRCRGEFSRKCTSTVDVKFVLVYLTERLLVLAELCEI